MKRLIPFLSFLALASLAVCQNASSALELPAPHKTGGKALMDTLALRSTSRAFDNRELSTQQLADLLWAAYGINRPDGKRTAPSARNRQETQVFLLLKSGAYLYNAQSNRLEPVSTEDLRSLGGTQPFVKDAPLTILLVADLSKTGEGPLEMRREMALIDVGYISQNIYLYCASEGLATGARASVDKAALSAKLQLKSEQQVLLAQSVGYPKQR